MNEIPVKDRPTSNDTAPSTKTAAFDQAQVLRGLMRQMQSERPQKAADASTGKTVAIAVTSGKGGVGKSNIALNLAIALKRLNTATCLVDANFGLGNIDLLCGLNGYWNLSHVVTGARNVRDIVLLGPEGIEVIPGASGLTELADWPEAAQADVLGQLAEFEGACDFLIVDTAAGIHRSVRAFLEACDLALVVTTPEPTSVADAYSTIKALSASQIPHIEILVNQCDAEQQGRIVFERIAQTARMFLKTDVHSAGYIPKDQQVAAAVVRRKPFIVGSPQCPASAAIGQLAVRLKRFFETQPRRGSFFPRVQIPRMHKAA